MDGVAGIQHQVQRGMEHIRTCYVWSSIRPVHLETKLPVVTRVAVLVSISLTEVQFTIATSIDSHAPETFRSYYACL